MAAAISTLVFGFITSAITARVLGPASKGTLSTLLWLGHVLLGYVCSLGLGDAAIISIGKGRATIARAVSASLYPLLFTSGLGILVLWLVSFPADWSGIRVAVIVTGFTLVLLVYIDLFAAILSSRERFVAVSAITSITVALTALGTWIFVVLLDLGILGGVLGSLAGAIGSLAMFTWAIARFRISLRPTLDPEYLSFAVRYGIGIQAAFLLIAMSERVDQLLVYSLAGESATGQYTIALSVSHLVVYIPLALSKGTFPRLANIGEDEAVVLTGQVSRFGIAAGILGGVLLLPALPFVIPALFGQSYAPAILPGLLLVPGAVMWSWQWILARAAAARGNNRLIFSSFGCTVIAMLVLDYLLIPNLGITGAALASTGAATCGVLICLVNYARHLPEDLSIGSFLPRLEDFHKLFDSTIRQLPLRSQRKS